MCLSMSLFVSRNTRSDTNGILIHLEAHGAALSYLEVSMWQTIFVHLKFSSGPGFKGEEAMKWYA